MLIKNKYIEIKKRNKNLLFEEKFHEPIIIRVQDRQTKYDILIGCR